MDGMEHVNDQANFELIEKVVMLIKGFDDRDIWIKCKPGKKSGSRRLPQNHSAAAM